jgi:hypothetical protein
MNSGVEEKQRAGHNYCQRRTQEGRHVCIRVELRWIHPHISQEQRSDGGDDQRPVGCQVIGVAVKSRGSPLCISASDERRPLTLMRIQSRCTAVFYSALSAVSPAHRFLSSPQFLSSCYFVVSRLFCIKPYYMTPLFPGDK